MSQDYSLIDSGHGRKLERFGAYFLSRPSSQAVWRPQLTQKEWDKAEALFTRESDKKWNFARRIPESWVVKIGGISFNISPTDFGHLGVFPEQEASWEWITEKIQTSRRKEPKILNLFAYSGGSTLAAARAGAQICHLDASKGMVTWARENAALNKLENAPIRWIVEDVKKFLQREIKRGNKYDGIILDPPSFGRGNKGEVFKIEEDILDLLGACRTLLSSSPLFLLFSCHTPGFTPIAMHNLLEQLLGDRKGEITCGEMLLEGDHAFPLPSGTFARWEV